MALAYSYCCRIRYYMSNHDCHVSSTCRFGRARGLRALIINPSKSLRDVLLMLLSANDFRCSLGLRKIFNKLRSARVVTMQYIGALFRLVTVLNGFFWPVLSGTIIEACAAPFILNSQIIICNKWFSDKERALGTALLTVSMPVGTALAFALTGYYFQDVSGDNKENVNSLLKC